MNPTTRATVAFASAASIAAGGYFGYQWLAVAVLTSVFVLALGWPVLTWVPHWLTGSAIVLGGGALATVGVLIGDERPPFLRHMVVALAVTVLAALAVEVIRPSPPGQVVTAVAGTITGVTVAASGAAWIAAARTPGAEDLVVAGALSLAVAALASTATSRMSINAIAALTLGAASGVAAGIFFDSIQWYAGALVGLFCAGSVVTIHELTRRDIMNTSTWSGIAAGISPVTVAGTLVYIGGRLLVG